MFFEHLARAVQSTFHVLSHLLLPATPVGGDTIIITISWREKLGGKACTNFVRFRVTNLHGLPSTKGFLQHGILSAKTGKFPTTRDIDHLPKVTCQ